MQSEKCPNCNANMILKENRDGTSSFLCEYCGHVIYVQPKTISDKLMVFTKRAINAYNEHNDPLHGLPTEEELAQMSPRERKWAERQIKYAQAVARTRRR